MNKLDRRFAAQPRSATVRGRTRRMLKGFALLMALGGIAACRSPDEHRPFSSEVPPPPRFAQPLEAPASCTAEGARFALGAPISPPVLEDMRARTGAQAAQTIGPGDKSLPPAANRLLVEVDAQGRVVGARCA